VEAGVTDERLNAIRTAAGTEQDHVHDARRLKQIQRVVEQRFVDHRHQARVVLAGGGPEILVEETSDHHGLQHVLLLHFAAHGCGTGSKRSFKAEETATEGLSTAREHFSAILFFFFFV
jgi:phosphoserine phosphatase